MAINGRQYDWEDISVMLTKPYSFTRLRGDKAKLTKSAVFVSLSKENDCVI